MPYNAVPHIAVNAHLMSPVAGYRQAGVSRYISELLHGMWQARPDVRWTVYCQPGVARHMFHADPPPSVQLRRSRSQTANPVIRVGWEQFVSPVLLAAGGPDVLLSPLNVVPIFAPCPVVVVVHDLAFIRLRTHRASRRHYLTQMTRLSIRRATHVITVSEFTRREVLELFDVPESKVTAVPNGLGPLFQPRSPAELDAFRQRVGLPHGYLLCVGTLEPRKNLPGLIRAYAAAQDRLGLPLVIVGGQGWLASPVFDLVRQLGLESRVRFEGFVADADLPHYYGAATAMIYPSLYEGFGLPPLESMAAGTPVVTTRDSSMAEVVGDAALLVDPTDDRALADAMVRIATDDALRQRLVTAGLQRAAEFSWDQTAAGTLAVLLNQAASGRQIAPSTSRRPWGAASRPPQT